MDIAVYVLIATIIFAVIYLAFLAWIVRKFHLEDNGVHWHKRSLLWLIRQIDRLGR